MRDYVFQIEQDTRSNEDFRRVIFTGHNLQLVLMSIAPGEEIGAETHPDHDQFIRVESGTGTMVLGESEYPLNHGVAAVIPAGVAHNVINTSRSEPLCLYTLYGPPEHPADTIDRSRSAGLAAH
jgi:mannose-6-phosphate isomerase-like protein (cupin superfamily)